jgi:hypothetical protein
MMDLIGPAPVLWVDVYLVADDDAYSAAAAADWNLALAEEQQRYDNMHVFDWAPVAARHPSWMSHDRIHDTVLGSVGRARLVTDAAAAAFATGDAAGAAPDTTTDVPIGVDDAGAVVASLAPVPPPGAAGGSAPASAPRACVHRR